MLKMKSKIFFCSLSVLVLEILLVPNSSQAFRKNDEVVAQNRGPRGQVIVRSDHWVSNPWRANVEGRVPNGTRGTIQDGPERGNDLFGNELVWYKVKWRTADGNLEGWSAETVTVDNCKVIGPALVADQRDEITAKLFKMSRWQVANKTLHDYNDYGCDPSSTCGYQGGHSGLDVLSTQEGKKTFHSLTAGELIWAGGDDSNTIAVYDSVTNRTTLYLHARKVLVSRRENRDINVGDPLGIQGSTGNATGDHVHIEVRQGWTTLGSCGASIRFRRPNMDPIPYLYRWAIGARKKQFLPWDVNQNGRVNWYDKLLVHRNRWGNNPWYDVNSDGTVDRKDVDEVDEHIGDAPPAAPASSTHNQIAMTPNKTTVLPNYPNPFNPETWIPYELSKPTDVTVTIYAADGHLVRTLALGHQSTGIYQDKSRAAYWDGKNEQGEPVASGVYFYTLTAGEFAATRKMLIRK